MYIFKMCSSKKYQSIITSTTEGQWGGKSKEKYGVKLDFPGEGGGGGGLANKKNPPRGYKYFLQYI